MRRGWWVALVLASACAPEVLVGINFRSDAATDDAGVLDAGFPDAGASDAGVGDGGVDGGVDGGADGGFDGGVDAGFDGGVDLALDFSGSVVVDQLGFATYVARVSNVGGAPALDASVLVSGPAEFLLRSGSPCVALDAGRVFCAVGDLGPGAVSTSTFSLESDAGPGWRVLSATVSSQSVDLDAGNDSALFHTALTAPSVIVRPVNGPVLVDISFCIGPSVTAFSQCTPGSLFTDTVEFLADGGVDSLGMGFEGQWGQSPHQRNLAFRFVSGGINGARYAGASVSATCFEGVLDNGAPPTVGAFEACPR